MPFHKHVCQDPTHQGPRTRTHYDDRCTQPYATDCLACEDQQLTAAGGGATWEYHDSNPISDADPGL